MKKWIMRNSGIDLDILIRFLMHIESMFRSCFLLED